MDRDPNTVRGELFSLENLARRTTKDIRTLLFTLRPLVLETPPNVLGIIDDHWFKYVGDFGNAGPDKGKGGKYLLLPPGYDGEIPEGYHVYRSPTYGNLMFFRGFLDNGSTRTAVANSKKYFKVYSLSDADNPPPMKFINVSGKEFNTIHANDFNFFEEVNAIVQYEPNEALNPETLGLLAAITCAV
mgnify:CR=1 FL=1